MVMKDQKKSPVGWSERLKPTYAIGTKILCPDLFLLFATQISGRELFEFNPDLVQDDDDEAEAVTITRGSDDEEEDEVPIHDITNLAYVPTEADSSGTQASLDRLVELGDGLSAPLVNGAELDGEFSL